MTLRMFFGGWLYPDAPSTGFADADAALDNNEFDCAATGINVAETTSGPTRRTFNTFRTDITFLHFDSPQKTIDNTIVVSLATITLII
jgi:hypothetical protein